MLVKLAQARQVPDPSWFDMYMAASATIAPDLCARDAAAILNAAGSLGLLGGAMQDDPELLQPQRAGALAQVNQQAGIDAWVRTLTDGCKASLAEAPVGDALELLAALVSAGYAPVGEPWAMQALRQVGQRVGDLDASGCAQAVLLASLLCAAQAPEGSRGLPAAADRPQPDEGVGPAWLDAVAMRMVSDRFEEQLGTHEMCDVAQAFAEQRHVPPPAWLQAFQEGIDITVLDADTAATLVISLASFRALPLSLAVAKAAWLQTYAGMDKLPEPLLLDLAWATAGWHAGKAGTPLDRFDYRPPSKWWDEWCKATVRLLPVAPAAAVVKMVWAVAHSRLVPPERWLQLLCHTAQLLVKSGRLTPLELLYVSRAADRIYGMLVAATSPAPAASSSARRSNDSMAGRSQVTLHPQGTGLSTTSEERTAGPLHADEAPASSATMQPRMAPQQGGLAEAGEGLCGFEPYEPPADLVALVQLSVAALKGCASDLPPGWTRLNMAWPPYALPDRAAAPESD